MADAILTYGGFPLATDVDQQVASFMDRYQSTEDLRDIAPALARIGSRADMLAFPNYPDPPKLRPNQLYWPTGASRWAIGYFFADDVQKDKIVAAAYPDGASNTSLELRVVENEEFTADLFLLTPRKVSCVDDGNNLWLLPLVDERYFWQFKDIGDFAVTTASTWANMFTRFDSQLGVSISADTADSKYLIPDPEELTRRYDNAGVMLDAVAHSIGQRLVRWPDGTLHSMGWATSATQLTANIESKVPWQQIAGGEFDFGPVPADVNVVCRRFVDHVMIPEKMKTYTEGAGLHLTSPETTGSTVKTVHSTAYAHYTADGTTVDNTTALDNLAEEIASDFYDSTLHQYDRTFAGIKLWDSCGYDDHVLYQFGGEYPELIDGEYEKWAHTRVQSSAVNFGTEIQLSQDPRTGTLATVLAPNQFGKLAASLLEDDTATFNIWEANDPGDRTDKTHVITSPLVTATIYNFPGTPVNSGTSAWIDFDFESERWYLDVTTPPASDSSGGTGDATTIIWWGTVQADTKGTGSSAWTLDAVAGNPGYDTVAVKRGGVGGSITVRLPHVGGIGSRGGPDPNLAEGNVIGCSFIVAGEPFAGTNTLEDLAGVTMTQSATTFAVNEFVGWTLTNQTTGASGTVTSNTTTEIIISGGLTGGSRQTWLVSDAFNMHDESVTAVCVTGYTDGALGGIKIWDGTEASIPFGWVRHTAMNAFMPVGVDPSLNGSAGLPDADTVAVTDSGQWTHAGHDGGTAPGLGHDTSDHTVGDHDSVEHFWGSGATNDDQDGTNLDRLQNHTLSVHVEGSEPGLGHDTSDHILDDEDHWPPLYPVYFIKRIHE